MLLKIERVPFDFKSLGPLCALNCVSAREGEGIKVELQGSWIPQDDGVPNDIVFFQVFFSFLFDTGYLSGATRIQRQVRRESKDVFKS